MARFNHGKTGGAGECLNTPQPLTIMKASSKMATDTLPAGTGRFSGLTDDQVLRLFEKIATTANLMAEICRDKAEEFGEKDVALTLHALNVMLSGIGAMADMPSGGACVGGFSDWMMGPLFNLSKNSESEVSHV